MQFKRNSLPNAARQFITDWLPTKTFYGAIRCQMHLQMNFLILKFYVHIFCQLDCQLELDLVLKAPAGTKLRPEFFTPHERKQNVLALRQKPNFNVTGKKHHDQSDWQN